MSEPVIRSHCLSVGACEAKGDGHCKRCAMIALNRNPDLNKRRHQTRMSNPDTVARVRANCIKVAAEWRATPEGKRILLDRARENLKLAHTPEAAEKRRQADVRSGIKRTLQRVPGLPEAGVDLFRFLNRKKGIPTSEAVRIVREETPGTPEHARREIDRITAGMRAKAARQKAQAY